MDRYQKVERPKTESPINENEIRITSQGLVRNYINYATSLLQERHGREIVLKGMGQAISKTVAIAEIMKRRIPKLHQDTAISSVSIVDVWEPIEEGLLPVETSRHVSMISISLSTKELNKNSPGYQAPPFAEQSGLSKNYQQQQQQQQPQQQPRQARLVYNAVNADSYARGRGRAHGRGRGRDWNRDGYGNYQENGGYSNWGRAGYGNYQENGRYSNWDRAGYGNYQQNGGYQNSGRVGGRGGGYGYRGTGYGRGRGGGGGRGYGYGHSHGRTGGYPRDGGIQV